MTPVVEKGLSIVQSVSKMWGPYDLKQNKKQQGLVFPEGIGYSKGNDAV
jgi:hypothetical protein